MNELQCLVFASIISADNDEYGLSEYQKQQIISRYDRFKKETPDWGYILQPIQDEGLRSRLVELLGH